MKAIFFALFLAINLLSAVSNLLNAQSCNCAWAYKVPITITNPGATTLTNYQVSVTVNTSTLVTANKMISTGDDIRFSDAACTNLPYWIESGMNNASTVIWINVNNISPGTTTTIYMYYGNPVATPASNGNTTFMLFDDFTGASLDLTKWTPHTSGGTVTVSGGSVTFNTPSEQDADIVSNASFAFPYISEIKVNAALGNFPNLFQLNAGSFVDGVGLFSLGTTMYVGRSVAGCSAYGAAPISSAAAGTLVGQWSVVRTSTVGTVKWPGGTIASGSFPVPTASQSSAFGLLCQGEGNMQVDWFRARKYYATGTTQSVGAETANSCVAAAALNFDGVDDKVVVTNSTVNLANSSFSVEMWVKRGAEGTSDIAFSQGGGIDNSGTLHIGFRDNGAFTFAFYNNDLDVPGSSDLLWHHWACTFDNVTKIQKVFKDGVLVGQRTATSSFVGSGNTNLYIGDAAYGSTYGPPNVFNGTIDEVRVWNTTRTCDQVRQLRNCELTGSESGLVAYYKFNQGYAGAGNAGVTTLTDATANHNDGTLNNFTLTGATSNWVAPGGVTSGVSCSPVTAPEINVQGNGNTIDDGDGTPSATDNTDFGNVNPGSNSVKTFTIQNTGTASLIVSGITMSGADPGMFTVAGISFPATITPGNSATFTLTFAPTSTGQKTATVHIASNDCDEADYDYAVQGNGSYPSNIRYVTQTGAGAKDGSSWSNAYGDAEFQPNLNSAASGLEFWVAAGTYKPTGTATRTISFVIPSGVSVYGGFAGGETLRSQRNPATNVTTLSGDIGTAAVVTDNSYHVVNLTSKNTITFDGFTIRDGYANSAAPEERGAGIYVSGSGTITLDHLNVTNNEAKGTTTTSGDAGGLYIQSSTVDVIIQNSSFQFNKGNYGGGGVATLGDATVTFNNSTFTSNSAGFFGGGMELLGNTTINNCIFKTNTANGGAVVNYGTVTINKSFFYNNNAPDNTGAAGAGTGGAFQNDNGTATLTNCVLANNSAGGTNDDGGGAMMVYGGTVNLTNCTLSENTTASTAKPNGNSISLVDMGGGSAPVANLKNTIVWGTATKHINNEVTINYTNSLVKGEPLTLPNKNVDPLFVNAADPDGADNIFGTSDDGLMISNVSPARDAGTSAGAPADDVIGTGRPQGAGFDMGAYEVFGAAPSNNADLSNLVLSEGTLSPPFAQATTSYSATVPNSTTSITETPTAADANATITVNGTPVTSGTPSGSIPLVVGNNVITTVVTAQDGTTTKTYTVNVTRACPSVVDHQAYVANTTSGNQAYKGELGMEFIVNNAAGISVKQLGAFDDGGNGITGLQSGGVRVAIFDKNTHAIVPGLDVTVVGNADHYTGNHRLKDIPSVTLPPGDYVIVAKGYHSGEQNGNAGIGPVVYPNGDNGSNAITFGNESSYGIDDPNGFSYPNTAANLGTTNRFLAGTFVFTTIAPCGPPSNNADLSNLVLSQGTLAPPFVPGTTSYTATVPNSTTSITVTPTKADAGASITVNGTPVATGTPSGPIALAVGNNVITTIVTAADGTTTKTYTVNVTRVAGGGPSTNADLSNLVLSQGTLTPPFAPATTSYSASVPNSTTSITVTPTKADAGASITVNGTPVASGSPSGPIALGVGSNIINVVVTAADGATTKTYTVNVTRAPAGGTCESGPHQAYVSNTNSGNQGYRGELGMQFFVSNASGGITVKQLGAFDDGGNGITGLQPGGGIRVVVFNRNTHTIVPGLDVTIIGNADHYTGNHRTKDISPVFLPPGDYTIVAKGYHPGEQNGNSGIGGVTYPDGDNGSGAVVFGTLSSYGPDDPNGFSYPTVEADLGTTHRFLAGTLVFTVSAPCGGGLSNNANLANLTLSQGALTPSFNSNTTSYTASVPNSTTSITLTPTKADPNATITVNGSPVASGTPSGPIALVVGNNVITTVVTAQDGTTTKTYTVNVTRAAAGSGCETAPMQAYTSTTTTGNQAWRGELGLTFTVNNASGIIVKQLGAFDDGANGITGLQSGGVRVAIFNKANMTIVPGLNVVVTGNGNHTMANHKTVDIAPVTLPPGTYVIVAKGYHAGEQNGNGNFPTGDDGGGAIIFVNEIAYGPDDPNGFAYPNTTFPGNPHAFLAGTLVYTVPVSCAPVTKVNQAAEETILQTKGLQVYPNPARGQFNVQLTDLVDKKIIIQVTDQYGKLVEQKTIGLTGRTPSLSVSFDLHNPAAGIYFIKVLSVEGVKTSKIVLMR